MEITLYRSAELTADRARLMARFPLAVADTAPAYKIDLTVDPPVKTEVLFTASPTPVSSINQCVKRFPRDFDLALGMWVRELQITRAQMAGLLFKTPEPDGATQLFVLPEPLESIVDDAMAYFLKHSELSVTELSRRLFGSSRPTVREGDRPEPESEPPQVH